MIEARTVLLSHYMKLHTTTTQDCLDIQCGAVITRSIFCQNPQKTPHSSPVRARYGVYFVNLASEWYSASVPVIIYTISYNIGSRYNGTQLYVHSYYNYGIECYSFVRVHTNYNSMSTFVHHFIAIGEFKLELQSGNAQFGSKSAIFFVPSDLEIWHMTLKINRAPLLYYIRLCASFQSHRWI